jgi:TorA maturation chaperone TorD
MTTDRGEQLLTASRAELLIVLGSLRDDHPDDAEVRRAIDAILAGEAGLAGHLEAQHPQQAVETIIARHQRRPWWRATNTVLWLLLIPPIATVLALMAYAGIEIVKELLSRW